ncbi:MAG: L,D-transpeptidase family protein [Candidatus Pacebacteria bacterium]|nr:L,D-transpeptidase family protein [Candidatus Paceibacterota bacterium]
MWYFLRTLIVGASIIGVVFENFAFNSLILPDFSSQREKLIKEKKDFIEINLEENKVLIFKGGLPIKEFEILAKGNPDIWGGTPAGLYYVSKKYKVAYSNILNVYMPWSIHFYGKYYIHGEPYYSSGRKLRSPFSGGCIRLKNSSAKIVFNFAKENIPVLVIDKSNEKPSKVYLKKNAPISAKSYLVAGLDSGQVFLKKDYLKNFPIGEIVSLLVASVVVENVDLRRKIKIGKEKYGPVDLLYPMLIDSSKPAMINLTRFLGERTTKELMQKKARAIMMEKTEILSFKELGKNKASAKDLFYLARYILFNRSPIFSITKGELVDFAGKFKDAKLFNKNIFSEREDFIGGKAGYVSGFGEVGLFVFSIKNIKERVAIIILGSESLKEDTEKILKILYEKEDT